MDVSALTARVRLRYLEGEAVPSDNVIAEMLTAVIDRITIRMETTEELPDAAGSIVVDAAMKALRLRGYEGSRAETAADGGSVSNSFIDNVLSAYEDDLAALKRSVNRGGIKFMGAGWGRR